jgi:hypothetical protein
MDGVAKALEESLVQTVQMRPVPTLPVNGIAFLVGLVLAVLSRL